MKAFMAFFAISIFLLIPCTITHAHTYEEMEGQKFSECPKTTVRGELSDCLSCHIKGSFEVIEVSPDANRLYPVRDMRVIENIAYYTIETIDTDDIRNISKYLEWHPAIRKVVLDIFSPGGSLFDAHDIRGIMNNWKDKDIIVETRVQGFAASAGFLIFVSGSKDHRYVDPNAKLMWHELVSLEHTGWKSPSDQEEKARVLRWLQNSTNTYLSERSKLTKEQLDEKVKNKEFWMTGDEARENGFADGYVE
ncbi:ATP-dependent Clp protease proteolytic subunit [Patescibacteria group bacterium]